MKRYVVGFMFSEDRQFVALIRKNRPEWQAGKLNGIGGKIEEGETPIEAMVREFREETGVDTLATLWQWPVGRITGRESEIFIFRAFSDHVMDVATITDEKVNVYITNHISDAEIVPNLQVIIPALLLPDSPGIYLVYNNF